MNTNEFEAWLSRNVKNVGKGGKKPSIDPFNKALKGTERNKQAEEYPYGRIEGYHHYSERYSQKKSDDDREDDPSSRSKSEKKRDSSSKATRKTTNLARNIVSKVVAVAAGAVVVVSGYQAIQAHEAEKAVEPPPVVAEITWNANQDMTGGKVKLLDSNGVFIKEIPVTVTVSQVDPTCTEEGVITYTSTAEDGENTYSDTKEETIPPTGHALGEWQDVILENGESAKVAECTHCHQQFIISTSIVEE